MPWAVERLERRSLWTGLWIQRFLARWGTCLGQQAGISLSLACLTSFKDAATDSSSSWRTDGERDAVGCFSRHSLLSNKAARPAFVDVNWNDKEPWGVSGFLIFSRGFPSPSSTVGRDSSTQGFLRYPHLLSHYNEMQFAKRPRKAQKAQKAAYKSPLNPLW